MLTLTGLAAAARVGLRDPDRGRDEPVRRIEHLLRELDDDVVIRHVVVRHGVIGVVRDGSDSFDQRDHVEPWQLISPPLVLAPPPPEIRTDRNERTPT